MTLEVTHEQPLKQGLPVYSILENWRDKVPKETNLSGTGQILRGIEIEKLSKIYRELPEKEALKFRIENFPVVYPGCTTTDGQTPNRFSGIIAIVLEPDPIRFQEIYSQSARDPRVLMRFANSARNRIHIWLKAERLPENDEEFKCYYEVAVNYLRKRYKLTEKEFPHLNPRPTARYFLESDPGAYDNFFPELIPTPSTFPLSRPYTDPNREAIPQTSLSNDEQPDTGEDSTVQATDGGAEKPPVQPSNEKASLTNLKNALQDELHQAKEKVKEQSEGKEHTTQQQEQNESSDRPIVSEFPVGIFPKILQEVIQETVTHMNFRRGWIGSSILYAICVAVGNLYGVRYKNYKQRPLIYLALVGSPGTNKSAPPQFALAPLIQLDTDFYQTYKTELAEYNRWLKLSKKERESEELPSSMNLPTYRTLLVSDVTQEFLVQTHEQNPIGVGLFMDELAGWFKNFTRYNKGSEEQFWLSAWSLVPSGSGRKIGVSKLAQPFLPVAGTIQPGVLAELNSGGRNHNGFVDRLLFDYPDNQNRSHETDEELSEQINIQYHKFIGKLLTLRQQAILDDAGNVVTQWLQFSEEAFSAMRAWKNNNTDRINQISSEGQKGIYAKLDIYCIRFALIIELMDWACGESSLQQIRLASVERAIRLTDYFRQNAEKVHYELNTQSMAERLPSDQQRLFNALPDEVTTEECVKTAMGLTPPLSESTAKRLLKNTKLFKRVGYGEYVKVC